MKEARHDWVYIVDDDHYVIPHNVEKALAKYDPTKKIGLGCFGCGAGPPFNYCNGKGGFCGGCAYAFSKATVEALMQNSEGIDFLKAHKQTYLNMTLAGGREDMAISCLLDRLVPDSQKYYPGGLGNVLPDMADIIMQGCDINLLSQHSVRPAKMFYKLHEQWHCNSTHHPDVNVELEKYFQGKGANDTRNRERAEVWRRTVADAQEHDASLGQGSLAVQQALHAVSKGEEPGDRRAALSRAVLEAGRILFAVPQDKAAGRKTKARRRPSSRRSNPVLKPEGRHLHHPLQQALQEEE